MKGAAGVRHSFSFKGFGVWDPSSGRGVSAAPWLSSNATAPSLPYSYFRNGSADVITNNRDNGRTVTYGYDSLNRWNSASSQATSGTDCWGQSVPAPTANPPGYDRYGNLLTINVSKCSAPSLSVSVNGNNQVSTFSYNAAGDVTNDGTYSYSWDAESRLTSANGVTYTYDGDGQRVVTTSIGGLESQTVIDYDWNSSTAISRGLVTEVDEYGYGSGGVGSLVRKSTTQYNTSLNNNIYNRPSTASVYNGGGTLLRQTSYSYDGSSLTSTSGTPQHSNPSGSRGNVTGFTLSGSGFNNISKSITYYDTGGTNVVTDFSGAQTTHNNGTGNCGNSFDTTISMPMSLSQSLAWNCGGAVKTSVSDLNGNNTTFTYDNMDRQLTASYPDNGLKKTQYTSGTVTDFCSLTYGSVTNFCTASGSNVARQDETVVDGLGRTIHQDIVSDPSGETYVDTTYDSLGRTATVSNPYRSTSDPTYGTDTYSYDALNRTTKVAHFDGTYSTISYGSGTQTCSASTYGYGYPALYTDESGNQIRRFTDALGRVIEVDEPDPGNSNALDWVTCYGYDAQGNLTSVVQGSETRSYQYDGLSRLTQETTPEGGTTYYYYTTSGGALCANNPKRVCRKTDARGITITYSYDALDRLTGKSYSNGDATVTYYYDQTGYNGLTITNGKGRRKGMSDGSGQTAWSYDTMGRTVAEERTISSITKTMSYSYNLDGSLASITYPSGRVLSYSYGNDGRPVSVVDSANSINYATSATYAPQGALAGVVNGYVSGGFAGITTSNGYNSRLFPTSLSATSANGTALSLSHSYFSNGTVNVETNGRDNGRTATYGYDALNRVTSASSQATSGSDCWGQSMTYDRYANLTGTSSTQCSAPSLSLSVNTNNQITNSGFSYDAAGDLTADGVYSYGWSGEARLKSGNGVTYTYYGALRRVEKSSGTLYWYGFARQVLAESDLSGNIISEYALFNGQKIARRDVSSGNVYYIFHDRLGSYRTLTDSSGNVKGESDYYPFGQERTVNTTVTDNFRFAGMEWDSEDGLNHTYYRQYTPAQGRWETHDPKRGCGKFPQGLNLYTYVQDNASNRADPRGDCDENTTATLSRLFHAGRSGGRVRARRLDDSCGCGCEPGDDGCDCVDDGGGGGSVGSGDDGSTDSGSVANGGDDNGEGDSSADSGDGSSSDSGSGDGSDSGSAASGPSSANQAIACWFCQVNCEVAFAGRVGLCGVEAAGVAALGALGGSSVLGAVAAAAARAAASVIEKQCLENALAGFDPCWNDCYAGDCAGQYNPGAPPGP